MQQAQMILSNMKYGLTPVQTKVFKWIKSYITKNSYAPSYQEIMVAHKLSSRSHVNRIIVNLEKRKWIARIPGTARSITIL
jgi:SOS-response transcriptional repressor LexA